MSVSALDSSLTYQAASQYETVGDSTLDSADFMNLLITQLQYQDPTEPMDTNEMASQLAEFSSMEATQNMADNMEKLLDYQISQNNLQLLTLLGADVTVSTNMVGMDEGTLSLGEFTLDAAVESCSVEIYDASGSIVNTVDMGNLAADTTYQLEWDGTNAAGEQVADGAYLFVINGLTADGEEVGVEYTSTGTVTGLDFSTGEAILSIDNAVPADVGSVIGVRGSSAEANG